MTDQAVATKLLNDMIFVLSGGMTRTLPATLTLMRHLLTLELVLMGLYLAVGQRHAAVNMGLRLFWLSVLTLFVYSWGTLSLIFMQSLVQNALTLGGGVLTLQDFLDPGKVTRYGLEIIGVVFTRLTSYSGLGAVYNLPHLMILGFAAFGVWLAFFVLAAQIFIQLIGFYLSVAVTLIMLPFGAFRHTSFIAEKAFAIVISSSIGLAVLAVVASMALPFLVTLQISAEPALGEVFTILTAAGLIGVLAVYAPSIAAGIFTGAPALTASELSSTASSVAQGTTSAATSVAYVARNSISTTRTAVSAVRRAVRQPTQRP